MPKVVTRFAPSPTGYLHGGNYRTAVFAYLFARMAQVALDAQRTQAERGQPADPFYAAKLHTARFYVTKLLPETAGLIRSAHSGAAPLMAMDAALF